jgi:hypothetical protein
MSSTATLWLLTLALASSAARADESVYVVDQLVVSVTSTQDAESERVGQVKSGEKLELLEREGDAAHVRLSNGKDGWVKGSYLSSEAPASQRLADRTAELDKLKQEGEKQKQEGDRLRQDVTRLQTELSATRQAATQPPAAATAAAGHSAVAATEAAATIPTSAATTGVIQAPEPDHESVFLRQPDRVGQTPWLLLLGIAIVTSLVGFGVGWTTLDRRIRRKYGGLKIY